jgi:hypothetical protein
MTSLIFLPRSIMIKNSVNVLTSKAKQPRRTAVKKSSSRPSKGNYSQESILWSAPFYFAPEAMPSLSVLFPGTEFTFTKTLGTVLIEKTLFQKLLTSRIRAAKTTPRSHGLPVPARMPDDFMKYQSRLITRLSARHLADTTPTTRQKSSEQRHRTKIPKPKTKSEASSRKSILFTTSKSTSPSSSSLPPPSPPTPSHDEKLSPPQTSSPAPTCRPISVSLHPKPPKPSYDGSFSVPLTHSVRMMLNPSPRYLSRPKDQYDEAIGLKTFLRELTYLQQIYPVHLVMQGLTLRAYVPGVSPISSYFEYNAKKESLDTDRFWTPPDYTDNRIVPDEIEDLLSLIPLDPGEWLNV